MGSGDWRDFHGNHCNYSTSPRHLSFNLLGLVGRFAVLKRAMLRRRALSTMLRPARDRRINRVLETLP